MSKKIFLKKIKEYQSDSVFNPYSDICHLYDSSNAPQIRLQNLKKVLDSFLNCKVDSLWVGRDLGHRGGRRTGIAFTDEAHLELASNVWNVKLDKATIGDIFKERTATNIWELVNKIDEKIFMWNIFPFHPYENENHYSNRSHNSKERNIGIKILDLLIELLMPKKIVAIGNDAYNCLSKIFFNMNLSKIRHPSYGGEKIFLHQISELYNLQI